MVGLALRQRQHLVRMTWARDTRNLRVSVAGVIRR